MHDRPFRILGLQQIAIGGLDKQRLRALWVDTLGIEATGSYRSERENVDEDILAVGRGPFKVEVDLMQPLDAAKKPAVHDPALNHIGLWVDDLAAAVDVADCARHALHTRRHSQGRRRSRRVLHPPEGQRGNTPLRRGRADRAGAGAARRDRGLCVVAVSSEAPWADVQQGIGPPDCGFAPGYLNSRIGWSTARRVARRGAHFLDHAVGFRTQHVFHFHRFDHRELLAGLHLLPGLHREFGEEPGHRRQQEARQIRLGLVRHQRQQVRRPRRQHRDLGLRARVVDAVAPGHALDLHADVADRSTVPRKIISPSFQSDSSS